MTTYNYSINNFENGHEPVQLCKEIDVISIITATVLSINTDVEQNNLTITFDRALSNDEKTALDTVVAAHDPNNMSSIIHYNNTIDMNGNKIINLGDPTNDGDAVNKKFVNQAMTNISTDGLTVNATNLKNENIASDAQIDIRKLGDGAINNTEFLYLSGLTDNIQNQLNDHTSALSDHMEDQSNPHQVTKEQVGLSNVENLKYNYDATVNPSKLDDMIGGYSIGSKWLNKITSKMYICTDDSELNAVWKEITSMGEIIQGDNIGTGEGMYSNKMDSILKFKGIKGSDNVTLESDTTDITIKSKDSHSFLLSPIMVEPMTVEYSDLLYFPWLQSEFGQYKNGKLIFEVESSSDNPLSIRLRNVTDNSTLAELNNITQSDFYELPIANPPNSARLKIQVKKGSSDSANPKIFGIVLKYET
jgi:hypothetical protein